MRFSKAFEFCFFFFFVRSGESKHGGEDVQKLLFFLLVCLMSEQNQPFFSKGSVECASVTILFVRMEIILPLLIGTKVNRKYARQ